MLHRHSSFSAIPFMTLASSSGRRRRDVSPETEQRYSLVDGDEYEPYIPVAERRQIQLAKIGNRGLTKTSSPNPNSLRDNGREWDEEEEGKEEEGERLKEKLRKERTLLEEAQEVHRKKDIEGMFSTINGFIFIFDLADDTVLQILRKLIFRRQRRPMRRS